MSRAPPTQNGITGHNHLSRSLNGNHAMQNMQSRPHMSYMPGNCMANNSAMQVIDFKQDVVNNVVDYDNGQNAAMQNAAMQNAVMQNAAMQNAAMQNAAMQNAAMQNAAMQNTAMQNAAMQNAAMQNAAMQNVSMQNMMYCPQPASYPQMGVPVIQTPEVPTEVVQKNLADKHKLSNDYYSSNAFQETTSEPARRSRSDDFPSTNHRSTPRESARDIARRNVDAETRSSSLLTRDMVRDIVASTIRNEGMARPTASTNAKVPTKNNASARQSLTVKEREIATRIAASIAKYN
jgi:hypothetical protein